MTSSIIGNSVVLLVNTKRLVVYHYIYISGVSREATGLAVDFTADS